MSLSLSVVGGLGSLAKVDDRRKDGAMMSMKTCEARQR